MELIFLFEVCQPFPLSPAPSLLLGAGGARDEGQGGGDHPLHEDGGGADKGEDSFSSTGLSCAFILIYKALFGPSKSEHSCEQSEQTLPRN